MDKYGTYTQENISQLQGKMKLCNSKTNEQNWKRNYTKRGNLDPERKTLCSLLFEDSVFRSHALCSRLGA